MIRTLTLPGHVSPLALLPPLLLMLSACSPRVGSSPSPPGAVPQSIIFLIADGAGPAHWTLAAFADEELAVRQMKTVGLIDTRGFDHTVSGSAPTATAYATGVRSRMGMVGVGPDSLPRETVLEAAMERGMSTGLMTTTAIVDATPAAFGAHRVRRSDSGIIARQMSTKGIDVLMGGGRAAFRAGAQPDAIDLLAEVRQKYTYVESIDELRRLDLASVDRLLGLFAEGDMGVVSARGAALHDMTTAALRILGRNPNGFFLMIENEESDTQAHANAPAEVVIREMLDFDGAVRLALEYQADHPQTLVLVTGDHETGGISLTYDQRREVVMQYASGAHTGVLIPIIASGPGAERFGGIIRNDEVGRALIELVRARR